MQQIIIIITTANIHFCLLNSSIGSKRRIRMKIKRIHKRMGKKSNETFASLWQLNCNICCCCSQKFHVFTYCDTKKITRQVEWHFWLVVLWPSFGRDLFLEKRACKFAVNVAIGSRNKHKSLSI